MEEFCKPLRTVYSAHNDPTDDPSEARNTYSSVTIGNAKDTELCERTKGIITRVYTQDLYNQHEDRFMLDMMTRVHLGMVRMANPTHRWIAEMVIPPTKTIQRGVARLYENTLAYISHVLNIVVFGGSRYAEREDDDDLYLHSGDDYPADLSFIMANLALSVSSPIIRFCIYGKAAHWKHYQETNQKLQLFDHSGTMVDTFLTDQDPYSTITDESRLSYPLTYIINVVFGTLRGNTKLEIIDLHVVYKNNLKEPLPENVCLADDRVIIRRTAAWEAKWN